jgi:hypothetical protein
MNQCYDSKVTKFEPEVTFSQFSLLKSVIYVILNNQTREISDAFRWALSIGRSHMTLLYLSVIRPSK